jgi:tetratricopeptide (TPR) repeat protein
MILYRPVGLQELELIYDSGMKAFPARLPQQPIFYPVLNLEYARQTASDWNAKNGQFAGYVTQFKVEDQYISQFEKHTVGSSEHEEFWIPAEEMEEFNKHIIGHIKVVEAHFGEGFQGFIPEQFSLQGKNAVEQFTLLANSYLYKRMDFYLEIRRNHKAVFLNYPFWQKYEFKNPGLKEKILKAIKETWLTSFPQIPLPSPVQEDTPPVEQTDSDSFIDDVQEDITPEEQADAHAYAQHLANPVGEDIKPVKQTYADSLVNPVQEDIRPVEQTGSHVSVNPVAENPILPTQTDSQFVQGIKLGLTGKYQEAIHELSKAVEENPDDVVAHTSLGVAFHKLGENDRALSCYEAALRIDPIWAEAHYFRANILYSHGNVREAIAGYTIAIGLKPELIEAHQKPVPQDRLTDYSPSPAEMYWIAKPAHRILDLNKSLETNPGQAYLFNERAAEYYRLRNYVQAIADYSSSLEIQLDDASVLHLRGVAYEQIGQFDRALEDYQRAIAINPQLSDLYINRGVTFGKMGNFRQSIASFTEAIRLAPQNPDVYFNRGTAYLQLGDFERAIDDFSNVIRLFPGDDAAYYRRGISNEEAGRQREAIADYRQFLALSQDENARAEIEQKLREWNEGDRNRVRDRSVVPHDRQKTNQVESGELDHELDLYGLIAALGERALHSTWFGSGVECYGEKAKDLYAFTDQNRPIEGHDFLRIASGIRQTIAGDFQALDPGSASHWIFIRAWEGSGFYIETDDPQIEKQLKAHFQAVDEVEGANPPYQGMFIRI